MSAILVRAVHRSAELKDKACVDTAAFFRHLGKDMLRLRGNANAEARLECLYSACAFLQMYGEPRDALAFGRHGVELARSSSRLGDLRRFHTMIGILYADICDRGFALQAYVRSLELALRTDEGIGTFIAWNNLAALFVDSGLYEESLACARQALLVFDAYRLPDIEMVGRVHNNIALTLYRLGDYRGALASARLSVRNLGDPETAAQAASRVVREEHLVLALIANGELHEARDRIHYLRDLVRRFPSPRQQLVAASVEGLVEVLAGNSQKGLRILEDAVTTAEARQAPAFADALFALAQAYDATGNCEKALEATQRLTSLMESIHLDTSVANLSSVGDRLSASSLVRVANRAELKRSQAELQSKVLQRELARSRQEMLERMAVAADIREDISGEHGYRVGRMSALLAREIGWDRDACNALDIAARLHDIGKIGIPERILLDEKILKEAERLFIASHTSIGAEILSKSDIPQVRVAEEIARCHHEWWDGSGYPRHLKGTAVPKSARIVALADSFDAMTHGRPYAKAIAVDAALDEVARLRGRQFDPELTDHFLALVRRLAADNPDLDAFLGKAARNSPFLKARARIKEMLAKNNDSAALTSAPASPGTPLN